MTRIWPQLAALDDDERRQLIRWIGGLHLDAFAPGQMHIDAVVASLQANRKPTGYSIPNELTDECIVAFGIGDLPAMSTASYYSKGRATSAIRLKQEKFKLDCTTQKLLRLSDRVNESYPLRIYNIVETRHRNAFYDCSFTCVEYSGDPHGVLGDGSAALRLWLLLRHAPGHNGRLTEGGPGRSAEPLVHAGRHPRHPPATRLPARGRCHCTSTAASP
ncbi:hypothetical protein [Deinococcus wulumuqiensis]|uniref:hypothetical protein n=1 Tax=Deinococcus wulumuqiensis TaxID=980427 RepID=UPI0013C3584A|nr:hypothetical protein [Deinococcus wulumuqiensis]